MAMCHTHKIVPTSALQREQKKKKELEEQLKKEEEAARGEGNSAPGEQGEAQAKAAGESLEVPVWDVIPYLVFFRDVTDEQLQQLVSQLKPWGVPMLVYHWRDNMRHLETRGQKRFHMGPWGQGQDPAWTERSWWHEVPEQ